MAFAYYVRERRFFGSVYHVQVVGRGRVEEIVAYVSKHYGLPVPRVTFRGKSWCRCMWKEDRLSFTDSIYWYVGVVAHELAHYVENKKKGNHRHDAALMRRVAEILNLVLGKFYPEVQAARIIPVIYKQLDFEKSTAPEIRDD